MKRRRRLLIITVVGAILCAVGVILYHGQGEMENMTVRDITPQEAMRRIDSGEKVVMLDVRTPGEYAEKRIPGSVPLPSEPVDEVTAKAAGLIPDRRTTIFVYCRSGRRSKNAVEALQKLGYRNAYNLGGINDWPYATESGSIHP